MVPGTDWWAPSWKDILARGYYKDFFGVKNMDDRLDSHNFIKTCYLDRNYLIG